jgi:hypothetical protein
MMVKPKLYPASFGHKKYSVLPSDLQSLVLHLSNAVMRGGETRALIKEFRDRTNSISADSAFDAIDDIKSLGDLHSQSSFYTEPNRRLSFALTDIFRPSGDGQISKRDIALFALKTNSEAGYFLMFHGDGFVREAALRSIELPPQNEFEFTAVIYRLNDWALPVRDAAVGYAQKFFVETSPELIANSSIFLLPHVATFRRWPAVNSQLVEDTFFRKDVLAAIEEILLKTPGGAIGRTLEHLMRRSDFDIVLKRLLMEAKMPNIRAAALEALLSRRTRWFVGRERKWIDKTYNKFRSIAKFDYRDFDHAMPMDELLSIGAQDRSARVRRVVADTMIERVAHPSALMDKIAAEFVNDKNDTVRARAIHYNRNRAVS